MLYIIHRVYAKNNYRTFTTKIVQQHYASRDAAIDSLINYDFIYAEWCGSELKSSDLSGH